MTDINDLVFNSGAVTPEQQARIAASLRNRDQMGLIMAMSGDKALAPAGQQMSQSASTQRQQAINQEYYRRQMEQAQASLTERKRQTDLTYQLGMNRNAMLGQIAATKAAKSPRIPYSVQKATQEHIRQARNLDALKETFDPKWESNFPGSSALRQSVARYAPMLASQETKDYRQWMANFKAWYENPRIHELYGAVLAQGEAARWEKQAMSPDASPKDIKRFLEAIQKDLAPIVNSDLALFEKQYGSDALRMITGDSALSAEEDPLDAELQGLLQELGADDGS